MGVPSEKVMWALAQASSSVAYAAEHEENEERRERLERIARELRDEVDR